MIIGIGVDIVHLPRIAQLVARRGSQSLARRILSPCEFQEFTLRIKDRSSKDQVLYLGSRWCIKEAVYKALYPTRKLEWKQVWVTKEQEKPVLHVANAEALGIHRSHVSLSHDGEYAIAQVVLEGKN